MNKNILKTTLLFLLISTFYAPKLQAGEPVCHILICCRSQNEGIKFLVNGEWNSAHDYGNIEQVRDILQKVKDTGIKIVIVDMTNASQWTRLWEDFEPMVNNIQQVCTEKEMQFFLFIGASLSEDMRKETGIRQGAFEFWNDMAKKIWETWAQKPSYRKYGFGDNRPILIVFQPADIYWENYDAAPINQTNFLAKFRIGTTQVNDQILSGKSDGWGYRNYSQSVDGKVRFVAPNGGVPPTDWKRISGETWHKRVEWANKAEEYSIYGSYDDVCDAIHWGIADTKNCKVEYKKYPGDDSYLYYNIVKEIVGGKK